MKELELKYGCNPNQKPARIFIENGELPIEVLGGRPGYINFLDALNGWQLVSELKAATGLPAATSFKHVSPAGAAVGLPMSETLRKIYFVDDLTEPLTPIATAYARARGADRMSSYGDFIALSDTCDLVTALLIKREVSDGVIAPGFTDEALEVLRAKRKGTYCILKIDPAYRPEPLERKQVFGITFEQGRNNIDLTSDALFENIPTDNKTFTPEAIRDLRIALITLKYTQSNSVCYAKDGQAIGIGAGQQSRIHCTRLAGNKADIWWLRQHPKVMALPWVEKIRRADRDNTIDIYISDDYEDVLAEGVWQQFFTERPDAPNRLRARKRKNGLPRTRALRSALTLSSPSATTSSGRIRAAWPTWLRPAAACAMTMLSRPAISTASQWPSPAYDCSTINQKDYEKSRRRRNNAGHHGRHRLSRRETP